MLQAGLGGGLTCLGGGEREGRVVWGTRCVLGIAYMECEDLEAYKRAGHIS